MSKKVNLICNIYGFTGGNFAGNVYGIDGSSPTISACGGGGNRMPMILIENERNIDERKRYRIRKLTPTECFRLMGVDDKDIGKMLGAGIAKTNLYKLAGNSIVVSCLYHIFRKLFIDKRNESQQLELF